MAAEGPERRFEPWPFILAGLLLAMMAGSLTFYGIAARHPDPLVVADAFSASERYNQVLAAQRASAARGIELALGVTRTDAGVWLRVALQGGGGEPLEAVRVQRIRPAEGRLDAGFELEATEGAFEGEVPLPRPGRWELEVSAEVQGAVVRQILRLAHGS